MKVSGDSLQTLSACQQTMIILNVCLSKTLQGNIRTIVKSSFSKSYTCICQRLSVRT